MEDLVAVEITDGGHSKTNIHISDRTGNYATLCGLDGNDPHPQCGQQTVSTPKKAKVDCEACAAIWRHARKTKPLQIREHLRSDTGGSDHE